MQIPLKCANCGLLFYTNQIFSGALGANQRISLQGCYCACPQCKANVIIPDIEFKGTIDGILNVILGSSTPVADFQRIIELLNGAKNGEDLKRALSQPWLKKYEKWLPDSPEKIATYLAIFYTLMQMWSKNPIIEIDYNQFNIQYNHTLQLLDSDTEAKPRVSPNEI